MKDIGSLTRYIKPGINQIENMSAILSNQHSNPSQNTNKEVAHSSNSSPPALICSQESVISSSETSSKREQSIFSVNS